MAVDQRKLRKEHVFTSTGTAAELLKEFEQIAIHDKKLKGRGTFIRWIALAVFLALAAGAVIGSDVFIYLAVFVPTIILGAASFVTPPVLSHDRVEFLRLTLAMLSQDAGQRGRFEVLLRLRAKPEKISESANPQNSTGTQALLRDSWLTLAGSLSDGTSISESCADLIRRRTKRNPRGKTKMKDRRICLLRVQLAYKSDRYGDAVTAAGRLEKPFRLPEGAQMKGLSSTDKALVVKTIVNSNLTPEGLHAANQATLLGAYRILNLARKHAVAGGGQQ